MREIKGRVFIYNLAVIVIKKEYNTTYIKNYIAYYKDFLYLAFYTCYYPCLKGRIYIISEREPLT